MNAATWTSQARNDKMKQWSQHMVTINYYNVHSNVLIKPSHKTYLSKMSETEKERVSLGQPFSKSLNICPYQKSTNISQPILANGTNVNDILNTGTIAQDPWIIPLTTWSNYCTIKFGQYNTKLYLNTGTIVQDPLILPLTTWSNYRTTIWPI